MNEIAVGLIDLGLLLILFLTGIERSSPWPSWGS